MKEFHSEIFCLRQGLSLLRTCCLNCCWFAAGSDEAVAIAESAHRCRFALDAELDPAQNLSR